MTGKWQSAMTLLCWGIVVFGAVIFGAAFAPTDAGARAIFGVLGDAVIFDAPLRFATGLMGAVTIGWGLSLLALTSIAYRLDADVAYALWSRIAAAFAFWYVIDSIASVATGFALNAMSNTVIAIAFALILRGSGVLASRGAVGHARTAHR